MNWSKITDWFIVGVVVVLIVTAIFQPYDSTDDRTNDTRSGMHLYTDHGNGGCQYLRAGWFSPLVPRMAMVQTYGTWSVKHVCGIYREQVEEHL